MDVDSRVAFFASTVSVAAWADVDSVDVASAATVASLDWVGRLVVDSVDVVAVEALDVVAGDGGSASLFASVAE